MLVLRARLTAVETAEGRLAGTRVRLGRQADVTLPLDDPFGREAAVSRLAVALEATIARAGPSCLCRGSIEIAHPSLLAVPFGDVVAVLDAFHRAEVTDVRYRGRPLPVPPRHRP